MERKNASDGISRLDISEGRLSVPEGMTIDTSETENQREKKKDWFPPHRMSKNCGKITEGITHM